VLLLRCYKYLHNGHPRAMQISLSLIVHALTAKYGSYVELCPAKRGGNSVLTTDVNLVGPTVFIRLSSVLHFSEVNRFPCSQHVFASRGRGRGDFNAGRRKYDAIAASSSVSYQYSNW
jgi:hypothetical protein